MRTILPGTLDDLVWLNTAEAATYSRRHRDTVLEALRAGELKGAQASGKNGKWLVHRDDLDAWIRGEAAA